MEGWPPGADAQVKRIQVRTARGWEGWVTSDASAVGGPVFFDPVHEDMVQGDVSKGIGYASKGKGNFSEGENAGSRERGGAITKERYTPDGLFVEFPVKLRRNQGTYFGIEHP